MKISFTDRLTSQFTRLQGASIFELGSASDGSFVEQGWLAYHLAAGDFRCSAFIIFKTRIRGRLTPAALNANE